MLSSAESGGSRKEIRFIEISIGVGVTAYSVLLRDIVSQYDSRSRQNCCLSFPHGVADGTHLKDASTCSPMGVLLLDSV